MTLGKILNERIELEIAQTTHERGAFLKIVEHIRLGSQRGNFLDQERNRKRREIDVRISNTQGNVERSKIFRDLLVRPLNLTNADRNSRARPFGDETVPQHSLLLDALESRMHVGNAHTGPHVLQRELLETTTVRTRHLGEVAARSRCRNKLRDGAIEHRWHKAVERFAKIHEQSQIDTELVNALERPHARVRDETVRDIQQFRKLAIDSLSNLMGFKSLTTIGELGAVPGRITRAVLELAELRRSNNHARRCAAILRKLLNCFARQPCRRGWRSREQSETAQLRYAIENRDPKHTVSDRHRTAVVEHDLAQTKQRIIHIFDLRTTSFLAARNRTDDVSAQRARCDSKTRKPNVGKAISDGLQRGASRAHHENTFVLSNQCSDRVHNGLRATGSRQRANDERVSRLDLSNHILLLSIRIEKKVVCLRRALICRKRRYRRVTLLDGPRGGSVACERIEDRMLQIRGVIGQAVRDISERRDDQPWADSESLKV